MTTPFVEVCVETAARPGGEVEIAAKRDAAQPVRSQTETADQAMAAAVAAAHAMFCAERQALHARLTKLGTPSRSRQRPNDNGIGGAGADDAETRAWRAAELQRVVDSLLAPQPVHSADALTAAALRVRAGQSVDAAAVETRAAFGAPPTPVQRDAMQWIANSPYGQQNEWAAQHVLATQRHPEFSAAAAFASAVDACRSHSAFYRPSDEAVRCALDAFLRHGLELNVHLGTRFRRSSGTATASDADRNDEDDDDAAVAPHYARRGIDRYAWNSSGDTAWHTPLTLSVTAWPPMARALLSLSLPAACGPVDVHVPVRYGRGSRAAVPAVAVAAACSDAWVVCELVRRSGPATVARWPVFAECVCMALYPATYCDATEQLVVGFESHCAVVRELLRAFATDDDAGGLDLHTPPSGHAVPSVVAAYDRWIGLAKGWSCHAALRARTIAAYETTRDALRDVLERQRVFRDALPAVLSEPLSPAPREVCALVSAYVSAPAPSPFRIGAASASDTTN